MAIKAIYGIAVLVGVFSLSGCVTPHIVAASDNSVTYRYDQYNVFAGGKDDVQRLADEYCRKNGWERASEVGDPPLMAPGGMKDRAYRCLGEPRGRTQ